MGGEPHAVHALDVLEERLEERDARSVPDDVRMHGEQEQAALGHRPVELRLEDLQHRRRRRVRSERGRPLHVEVGRVVLDPLDRELDDYSPEATARKVRFYREAIDRLDREFPAAGLQEPERIDRDIIERRCRLALFDLEKVRSARTNPTVAVESIGTALFFPVLLEYGPDEERARDLLERLRRVPAAIDAAARALEGSARIYTEVAREENAGNREVVLTMLPTLFERLPGLRPEFVAARDPAVAAIDRFDAFLASDLAARSRGDWRLGPDLYREKFRATFGGDLDPAAVLAEAEAEMRALRAGMLADASPLHDRDFPSHRGHRSMKNPEARARTILKEVLDRIGREHPDRDRLLDAVRADIERIGRFLEEHPVVSLTRHDNLMVIETPPFLRGVYSMAGLHAAPPLQPELRSFFYVTPIPPDWPADRAESKLREYNNFKMLLLSIHEALPGHYTQLEYGNRVKPEWRRLVRSLFGSGATLEGWAEYAEEMLLDQGIAGAPDPRMRLSFHKEILRILANAILDIRLHTMGMTDRQAIDLMVKDAFQEKAEAEGKLRRAKLSSCQLPTYYVGWQAWRRLRRDVEAARGAAFDLRAFHDEALALGAVPPAALRRALLPDAAP